MISNSQLGRSTGSKACQLYQDQFLPPYCAVRRKPLDKEHRFESRKDSEDRDTVTEETALQQDRGILEAGTVEGTAVGTAVGAAPQEAVGNLEGAGSSPQEAVDNLLKGAGSKPWSMREGELPLKALEETFYLKKMY